MKDIKQIWIKGENKVNTWICFRKVFDWKKGDAETAAIAVDTKYRLYLNDELIIREGGLKRGPARNATYYEEIDLGEHLKEGRNTLAILVCFFGKDGFSHVSSKVGGLRFAMGDVVSDKTWKAAVHPAFVEPDEKDPPTNFRLAESNIYFDGRRDIPDWYKSDYDDTCWGNAYECTKKESLAWGELVKRIIPQFKNYDLTRIETDAHSIRLPYNAQFFPYIKVSAPAGKKILIKTDNYDTGMYDEKCAMAVYYTKEGIQEFESPAWLNGEKIIIKAPKSVKILELGFRETSYDTQVVKQFRSGDEFLNKLWDKCVRTLIITMHDTFMDCPDRERVQWWGDVTIEMQESICCLDEKALLLYKKGVESMAGWARGSHMMTVVPSGTEQFELPMQNLAGIVGFWYYYENTKDIDVPRIAYDMSMKYLRLYRMKKNGLVVHRKGSWDWPDWGEHADTPVMENAWYYMALKACKNMAVLLNAGEEDLDFINERMSSIEGSYNKLFNKNNEFFYGKTDNGQPDDRANALAFLSGLAPRESYSGITKVLSTTENSSPYMEKYVLDALCMMGEVDLAVKRIKRRYKGMVDEDYSTLWEFWTKEGTKNHAWSGGPLIIMDKYLK